MRSRDQSSGRDPGASEENSVIRPLHRFAPIVPVAALCLSLGSTGTASAKRVRDPDDTNGPLDIARVHVGQSGPRLSVRLQTFQPWQARTLSGNPGLDPRFPQSYLCLELAQDDARSRSCLTTTGKGHRRLTLLRLDDTGEVEPKGTVGAKIHRGGNRSFRASFRFHDAGLVPGRFGWRAISGWGDASCVPPARKRRRLRATAPAAQCTDQAPDGGGFVGAKIRRPRIVGCTHHGPLVRYHGNGKRKQVALTFDDGPSAYTSRVIKILDEHNAKGTFFVVGQEISGRQDVMRRALRHGHEIGNHTLHHAMLPSGSDLRATSSMIRAATGFRPCEFRPPGGAINSAVARTARSAGMTTVVWDVDTRDWTGLASSPIYSRAISARRGSIVLMHDGGGNRSPTVSALPSIVANLKRRGFKLVTVSRLIGQHPIWRP
jgi:peptidoglycan/xylan/chitin deacetylase (PgdA/CDA1 family)